MKVVSIIVAVVAAVLAAVVFMRSQSDEPQAMPDAVDTGVIETVETEAVEETADDGEEASPALVEESSGEPEPAADGEQPLILAQADTAAANREWKFSEGKEFTRMVPAQPTVGGGDQIEVAEFFMYSCNHCFDLEPYLNRWAEDLPANVRLVRVPAMWNPLVELHGKLYYTEEVLAENGKLADREGFRNTVFLEMHRRGNRLASEAAIQSIFAEYGVSAEDFRSTWNSFEVAQKMNVGKDLARRYGLAAVPMIAVNGKYKTSGSEAGSYPRLLEVIDELIEREEAVR